MAPPTNVFHLVNGTVEKFVGEFIDYLDGIPSKNFCPNGRIITPSYAKILRSRVKEITSHALTNCERKKCLGYIINDLMSPLQYCNMAGFNLVLSAVRSWSPNWITETISSMSFLSHFTRIQMGVFDLSTLVFFISMMILCLWINVQLVQIKKAD